MKIDFALLKNFLNASIKDCSLQMDECKGKRKLFGAEKSAYESVLNFISTHKDELNMIKSLKDYLTTSIKDYSLRMDECEDNDDFEQRDLLSAEQSGYECILNFIDTYKED